MDNLDRVAGQYVNHWSQGPIASPEDLDSILSNLRKAIYEDVSRFDDDEVEALLLDHIRRAGYEVAEAAHEIYEIRYLLPLHIDLKGAAIFLIADETNSQIISTRTGSVRGRYDFIIIMSSSESYSPDSTSLGIPGCIMTRADLARVLLRITFRMFREEYYHTISGIPTLADAMYRLSKDWDS